MAKNKKVVTVLSTAAITGLITTALGSTAFAKTSAVLVNNGNTNYKYDLTALNGSYADYSADSTQGALYQDYASKIASGKVVAVYDDAQKAYIDFAKLSSDFADANATGQTFDLNAYTEASKNTVAEDPATISDVSVGTDGKVVDTHEVTPVTSLAVSSVTGLNVKQIQVTFNEAVDKTTAETVSNYSLGGTPLGGSIADVAKLQADGKTVVITLFNKLPAQYSGSLTVSNVKDTSANAITATTKNFTVADNVIPQVTSATLVSPAQIKVKFSEPVQSSSPLEYSLDNGQYSISGVVADPTDDSAVLTLSAALPAGTHSLVVSPIGSGYAPTAYNTYAVPNTTLALTAVTDNSAPVASVSSIGLSSPTTTKVQFKFSKPVALNGAEFYWGYNKVDANKVVTPAGLNPSTTSTSSQVLIDQNATTYTIGTTTYADTYNVTFNTVLPVGTTSFFIDNDADVTTSSTNYILDTWGNKFQSTSLTGTLTTDTTKPAVSSVALDSTNPSQDKIDVTFSKAVSNAQTGTNYVLKDSTGAVVTPATLSGANVDYSGHPTNIGNALVATNGYYDIDLGTKLKPGTYTLTVSGIQDTAYPTPNTINAQTYTFTVSDTSTPSVNKVRYSTDKTKVFVYYTKAMALSGAGSILDPTNYQFNYAALPAGTTITATNNGTVAVINFPSAQTTFTNLAVGAVRDTLGNTIAGLASQVNPISADAITAADDIVPGTVTATAQDTITFEVDQPLSGVNAGFIYVNGSSTAAAYATYTNQTISTGKYGALVTVKASSATPSTDSSTYSLKVEAKALTNANGVVSTGTDDTISTGIIDKVAPLISTATVTDTTTGAIIGATSSDGKNFVVDLSTVRTTDLLNSISLTATENETITIPLETLNGVTVPAQTRTIAPSGSTPITLASLAGITDNGNNGVTESKLKQVAGASDTITLPITIIDQSSNHNTTTGTITIKGLR